MIGQYGGRRGSTIGKFFNSFKRLYLALVVLAE
jgi:hypothetical protein